MKPNELMIGDWVVYNGDVDYINPIKIEGMDIATGMCITSDRDDVGFDGVDPIPLTAEILEKNGFTQCEPQGYDLYVKDKNGAGLYRIFWQGESYNYYLEITAYAYPLGEFSKVNIKYVHQLQHALRLCNIDKEIEL